MMRLTKLDDSDHFEVVSGVCKCFRSIDINFSKIAGCGYINGDFRYPPMEQGCIKRPNTTTWRRKSFAGIVFKVRPFCLQECSGLYNIFPS